MAERKSGGSRAKPLTPGTRFGRLVVIGRDGVIHTSAAWLCQCDCGNTTRAKYSALRRGEMISCGCYRTQIFAGRSHGMKGTPEFKALDSAIQRTTNPNHKSYAIYGGRGIKVCERWRNSFEAFYADMGPRPSPKHSLDRFPDKDGNYEPGNCRWATWIEQANNRRNNTLLTINGVTKTLPEWARAADISQGCLYQRHKAGVQGIALLAPSIGKPRRRTLRETVHG